ncbi:dTDP-4-dehydrorhamnose 3,5-epimerase family protein [Synechococcus sp. MIT S1220]|uniref:dTDP-4-dehydrorhamnose 3,5-epimerase family protein n=1 Tax=Synechococcus sp. MIT S1220 TaxID=3082549 RepID=UPI0039AF9C14
MRRTPINGLFELVSVEFIDSRGAFLNAFRAQEDIFKKCWGDRTISQVNLSRTDEVGTIRGLHLQAFPNSEAKLVRCLKGRVWDVAVDLRDSSTQYGRWHAIELSPCCGNALFIPEGFAHGFQVLEPGSEILYLHSGRWVPESETGVRWDDPHLAIPWPLPVSDMSPRDRSLSFLST